ncbi:MAG: hypothetical protein ABI137_14670 [Antricoccus sp.]
MGTDLVGDGLDHADQRGRMRPRYDRMNRQARRDDCGRDGMDLLFAGNTCGPAKGRTLAAQRRKLGPGKYAYRYLAISAAASTCSALAGLVPS